MKEYECPECGEYQFIQKREMEQIFYSDGQKENMASIDILTPVPLTCINCGTQVPVDIALKHWGIIVPKEEDE